MQKYVVQLTDDISGEDISQGDGESVRFALDGAAYTIDLTAKNAEALREAFQPYVLAARRSSVESATRSTRKSEKTPKEDLTKIREWLGEHGHKVSSRGRIPGNLRALYAEAH